MEAVHSDLIDTPDIFWSPSQLLHSVDDPLQSLEPPQKHAYHGHRTLLLCIQNKPPSAHMYPYRITGDIRGALEEIIKRRTSNVKPTIVILRIRRFHRGDLGVLGVPNGDPPSIAFSKGILCTDSLIEVNYSINDCIRRSERTFIASSLQSLGSRSRSLLPKVF